MSIQLAVVVDGRIVAVSHDPVTVRTAAALMATEVIDSATSPITKALAAGQHNALELVAAGSE